MSGNTIGQLFCVTTFGESHGEGIGCVIDGCPAGFEITASDIQAELDRRKPGQSRFTSQRRESDRVQILSGIFEGTTTGAPIMLWIPNSDQRSKDYDNLKSVFRPGHGDYSYFKKYGHRDHRGGGRASARETASRVAAAAIAKKFLRDKLNMKIEGMLVQMGNVVMEPANFDKAAIAQNPFFCPEPAKIPLLEDLIESARREGDSLGALVEIQASNMPVGLGEPVFDRLDADLAKACMSINAVKGVEIGDGFDVVTQTGSEHRDEMTPEGFLSNHAGGILAGISTGQPLVVRLAFKPPSSITKPAQTLNEAGDAVMVQTKGRHDPCVGIRGVVVAEAMVALVLMDHVLRTRGSTWI